MVSKLDLLPQGKRDEIAFVVDVIRTGFDHATARRTQPHLRAAMLLKILLFGSHARGDWIDDPVGRYFSDYDMLLVVNHEELTDWDEYWAKIDRQLIDAGAAGTKLRTQVSLAPHSLDDVNEQLRLGRYFFIDAVREGIVLYEEEGYPFAEPHPLTPAQALEETQNYYREWFESSEDFLQSANDAIERGKSKLAAFLLHQAAERAYHCLLLVETLYSPKTHKLNKLRAMAENIDPRLRTVWPNASKAERRAYGLLVDAYVKARYSLQYNITVEQLDWLRKRIKLLMETVETVCRERLATLEQAA